uniref:Uncharacterized protein n=1 Tax=viral metagenome TaxID=1070528 RepID=A0A6C0B7M9_9ZZZZ
MFCLCNFKNKLIEQLKQYYYIFCLCNFKNKLIEQLKQAIM